MFVGALFDYFKFLWISPQSYAVHFTFGSYPVHEKVLHHTSSSQFEGGQRVLRVRKGE